MGRWWIARGYGMANLEHSVAVTPTTIFHIASISKNILAAVVLQLVDEGKLLLDEDVTKYVPEAPTHGRHVTVRQLLNHPSGIYSFTSLPEAADNERLDLTHEQVLGLMPRQSFLGDALRLEYAEITGAFLSLGSGLPPGLPSWWRAAFRISPTACLGEPSLTSST